MTGSSHFYLDTVTKKKVIAFIDVETYYTIPASFEEICNPGKESVSGLWPKNDFDIRFRRSEQRK